MKKIFTEEQEQFMKDNYLTMSYKDIAAKLGFTERQVRGRINNMGLTKLRKFNDHYFDSIDSPIKAYLLGFIYADGWVIYNESNRNYEFGMDLQSEDEYVLQKINDEFGGQHIIKRSEPKEIIIKGTIAMRHNMSGLRVYSKNIVTALIAHGVVPNKTQHDNYPIVDDKLFFDFLRGYIDGDGCYYIKNNNVSMHITCATRIPLEYISLKLKYLNIHTSIYKLEERKYRLVCYRPNDMKQLINLLYYNNDVFCLKRKFTKIKTLINGSAA